MNKLVNIFVLLLSFICSPSIAQWVDHEKRLPDIVVAQDPWAPVEVIMYFSFSCGHCAQFHNESWDKFKKDYVDTGKVKVVLRDVALDQVGYCTSTYANMLSREDYLKFFDISMKNQTEWLKQKDQLDYFVKMAQMAGLPKVDLDQLRDDTIVSDKVLARWNEAKKKYYLDGTPGFIINGKIYNYYMKYDEFEAKVKEELNLVTKNEIKPVVVSQNSKS
ncbi:MAG: thioredoxin domain-containing protein [Alphaproteobacteria bacterium]|nr:thioredoxin domain-containing protein [Alphaproteobacteria bacterium]